MMNIKSYILSAFGTNCYLVWEDGCPDAFIVDPGAPCEKLAADVAKNKLDPKYIILTHGHGDHTGGIPFCKEKWPDIKVVANKKEEKLLYSRRDSYGKGGIVADIWTHDGDILKVGNMELKFIFTPGHTPGGQCVLVNRTLFSGDTLFHASIGRTDLWGGSFADIMESITTKLFLLPEDTTVLPGHMDATTIGYEMRYNPFV